MTFPSTSAYPKSFELRTIRASAVLLGASAWDVAPLEMNVSGFSSMTLFITYTRAGAGGAVNFQIQASPRAVNSGTAENWFSQALYDPGAIAAGVDAVSNIQRESVTYTSTAAGAQNVMFGPVSTKYIERLRVPCRETGAAGTPGTVHIVGLFYE